MNLLLQDLGINAHWDLKIVFYFRSAGQNCHLYRVINTRLT